MSLKQIKNKIRGVDKTHKVTKAMEAVSAVKMRKSQERALTGRPYARAALSMLNRVADSIDASDHPLVVHRGEKKICLVVVTSDKGLAGILNSAVLREASRLIRDKKFEKESVKIIAVGRKAHDYFARRGYDILESHVNVSDDVSATDMREITDRLVVMQTSGEIDKTYLVYTHFRSTFEQEAISRRVLPVSVKALRDIVEGIVPEKGKYANEQNGNGSRKTLYEIEPDAQTVLTELLPFLVSIELYHALLESKASEHSARMVAMKNASDKAEEVSDALTLEFNKARQSLITREVSEIVGGIEAMV